MRTDKLVVRFVFALVLLAGSAVFADEAASPPVPAADEVVAEAVGGSCQITPPLEEVLFQAACARCPTWAPKCNRDADCDAVCGGRVTGACIPFNSCVSCCACAS